VSTRRWKSARLLTSSRAIGNDLLLIRHLPLPCLWLHLSPFQPLFWREWSRVNVPSPVATPPRFWLFIQSTPPVVCPCTAYGVVVAVDPPLLPFALARSSSSSPYSRKLLRAKKQKNLIPYVRLSFSHFCNIHPETLSPTRRRWVGWCVLSAKRSDFVSFVRHQKILALKGILG
jgi:hypothetical protein